MAQTPYKINDRRGAEKSFYSGRNALIKSATHYNDRQQIPELNYDSARNISKQGLAKLRSVGRYMFSNFGPVRGGLFEQAELSVSTFIPQFVGEDSEFGKRAEDFLREWEKIMDLRGWPYDGEAYRRNLIIQSRVDGDIFTLLTEGEGGYPQIQVIPAHRIGSQGTSRIVESGPWKDYQIIHGAITNDYGRVVAWRVYPTGDYTGTDYVEISSANLFPSYFIEFSDQFRGISSLAAAAFDWQDVYERRAFEMLAQKNASSISLVEKNEMGSADDGSPYLSIPEDGLTSGDATGLAIEKMDGGTIRYLKNGNSLESLKFERPTADQQNFEASIIRGAFRAMEWDMDFSLDTSRVGGASLRLVVEKCNRTIEKNQALVEKALRRVHGYAIAKAIKLGLLPESQDWWRWEYQGPARVTADAKYDDDIARERIKLGGLTYRDWYNMRGMWWEDEVLQRIKEQKFIEENCEAIGVSPDKVQLLTPNGNQALESKPNETD
jgi:hypothetical protein